MKSLVRIFIVLLLVTGLVFAAGIGWRHAHSGPHLAFSTAIVKRGDVVATIGATGTIEPQEVVDVGAQVAGRVSELGVDTSGKPMDYGSEVREGALLAKIDDSVYAADLSVAKAGELSAAATLEQMQARLDQADAERKRPNRVLGSTADYLAVRNWPVEEGECFTEEDVRGSASVCVLGRTVVEKLFGVESPLGKEVRLRGVSLKVVGILARKGANVMGQDQDDFLLAPLTTVKFRVTGQRQGSQAAPSVSAASPNARSQTYPGQTSPLYPPASSLQAMDAPQLVRFTDLDDTWVAAGAPQNVPLAIRQISAVLRDRHHLAPGAPDDFRIRDLAEISQTFAATSRVMTNLLLGVALISLIVGGVGIMNIMLVSVTERTREIGIRMAVGARGRDILRQFLTEAIVLCLAGGIAGILLGRGVSVAIATFLHWPTLLSLPAIVASVAVSCTVGIVFGFYPAWKASRLDPIDALRYE